MLLTKSVLVTISASNRAFYENLDYILPKVWDEKHKAMVVKRGTKILVDIKDLSRGSHAKVDVKCDYCGFIKNVSYKDYIKNHDEKLGDCCVKCRPIKYECTMQEKYGVTNSFAYEVFKEKAKETNRKKYEYDWHVQRPEYCEKIYKEAMKRKYGITHVWQNEEFLAKATHTKHKNLTNPISKPQHELSYKLFNMYGNCEMERPCGRYSLDCVVFIDDYLVDIEYDGWFHHQQQDRDNKRDEYVLKQGYKIMRIRSNKNNKKDILPSEDKIANEIQKLLRGQQRVVIQM